MGQNYVSMRDIFSRLLAILAVLVGIATLVVLYFLWGLITENKSVFTDMLNGFDERIAALEERARQQDEVPVDTRELMPANYRGTLSAVNDLPTELVPYQNAAIGLSVKLPYNPAWGNRLYRVLPYEEEMVLDEEGASRVLVRFGKSSIFEGGGWARASLLLEQPARSVEEEIAHIQQTAGEFLDAHPIERLEIKEKTALVYYSGGLCGLVNVVVIGEKANYALYPTCGDTDEIREEFLAIVGTMEFISN